MFLNAGGDSGGGDSGPNRYANGVDLVRAVHALVGLVPMIANGPIPPLMPNLTWNPAPPLSCCHLRMRAVNAVSFLIRHPASISVPVVPAAVRIILCAIASLVAPTKTTHRMPNAFATRATMVALRRWTPVAVRMTPPHCRRMCSAFAAEHADALADLATGDRHVVERHEQVVAFEPRAVDLFARRDRARHVQHGVVEFVDVRVAGSKALAARCSCAYVVRARAP